MVQNRSKLIDLFIDVLSNVIVHELLGEATDSEEVFNRYLKEIKSTLVRAENYRKKINPVGRSLSETDIYKIRIKLMSRVKNELNSRVSSGYENVDFSLIGEVVEDYMKKLNVI